MDGQQQVESGLYRVSSEVISSKVIRVIAATYSEIPRPNNDRSNINMKIPCREWAVLAIMAMSGMAMSGPQAAANQGGLGGYPEPGASQATKPRAQGSTPPKPWEAKPWDTKPWEAAQEELRPGGRKAMEERRRAGRKARKERLENRYGDIQPVGDSLGGTGRDSAGGSVGGGDEQVRGRQGKWRRHQMESQKYYPEGMR